MRYSLNKAATTLAYFALVALTWRFLEHDDFWKLALAAALLSGLWLVLTYRRLGLLLRTYFDILSRLEVEIPFVFGILLSTAAALDAHFLVMRALAISEIAGWCYVFAIYRHNKAKYEIQGHGPVPRGCWISPPAAILQAGDLILTSGQVATRLRESVGHAELVLRMHDGSMKAFSSYMKHGIILQALTTVASSSLRGQGHYIVLRPTKPWTKEQIYQAAEIGLTMRTANRKWRDRVNKRFQAVLDMLLLPIHWKAPFYKTFRSTGYDWIGLFMGRLTEDHWTCIAACLEVYRRLNIETNQYGTGLLGMGTSVCDPIMPVRFLDDPAFTLLKVREHETDHG